MLKRAARLLAPLVVIATACALPLAARAEGPYTNSTNAAGENESQAFCFNSASGASLCAFSESCAGLTACTGDADCGAGQVCIVNTCCGDEPSPNVCITPASGFVCRVQGPFTCADPTDPFFPPCVQVGAAAPALSPPLLAVGVLLLVGIGILALRARRVR